MTGDKLKQFVFSCIMASPDVMLCKNGNVVQKTFAQVAHDEDAFTVCIAEDRLWAILTGYNKKESNLGSFAFELLLEIAKSKDKGINTKDLALATGQDPRSITGRIKKLEHLTCFVQMIYKGHVVKLLKLQKYAKSESTVKPYINIRDYLSSIVEVVRKSKNGVRQILDLKRELKFDLDKRLSKSFIAAINWLDEKQYLKKVLVVSPANQSVKIRCVKYLRDYIQEDRSSNEFEYDSDTGDDEPLGGEKAADEEDVYEGLDNFNATSLLQDQCLIVEEQTEVERNDILINRFYPIQNQTYDLADDSGMVGISTMQAISKLTGKDYKRAFTKSSEYYVENVGKHVNSVTGYNIVRVYDFEGKKKFYRFFTGANFVKLTDVNEFAKGGSFTPLSSDQKNLATLNKNNFVGLNSTLRFIKENDQEHFFWNGELKVPPSANAPLRGRKRKKEEDSPYSNRQGAADESTSKRHESAIDNEEAALLATENDVAMKPCVLEERSKGSKPEVINIGGFSANSLRSLWRQRAILDVVKKAGGVTYLREQFFEDVSHFMGSATLLDKKTVRGDVLLMVKGKKLCERIEPNTGRRIICIPDVDSDTVSNYVVREKDNKKATFRDVMHNTDLYFFDQTEKNRFHRGAKSAERIQRFQSRVKKSDQIHNLSSEEIKAKDSASRRKKGLKKVTRIEKNDSLTKSGQDKNDIVGHNAKSSFHVGNKVGARALIMAVVISKSIKNEISWEKITKLFPNNSLDNLKKQWTMRRVRMGHNGWRAYVDKWRKILVSAIKEERATLEDAEKLNLLKLIGLWMASEAACSQKKISLYKSYAENKKRYTLVKDTFHNTLKVGLSMSSMVQRETSLLNKTYIYSLIDYSPSEDKDMEEDVRAVIRSMLFGISTTAKEEIQSLKGVPKELVDKVVMDMAKEKQVYLCGSRLEARDTVQEVLDNKGNYKNFEHSEAYRKKLEEMFYAGNGVVISEEILDVASWVIIDLVTSRTVRIDALSALGSFQPFSYTTRKFGIGSLTPPLIITAKDRKTVFEKPKNVAIPVGNANSRLWIDSMGAIRNKVWKSLTAMILKEILFNPAISPNELIENCSRILSRREMAEICHWLVAKGLLSETPFCGFIVSHKWYTLME